MQPGGHTDCCDPCQQAQLGGNSSYKLWVLQVLELPEGAELLATSPTAPNEIWTYQDRVLAIQGHPEMPCEEALHKILPFLSANG